MTSAHRRRPLVALWMTLLFAAPAGAGQVRPLNLEEMTRRAERIFAGRCVAVETLPEKRGGVRIARATFEVERAVKGDVGTTVTVDVVAPPPPGAFASSLATLDVPRFTPGERVVLFLYPESRLGLTSPVGLGQGKLSIVRDKQGQDVAASPLGNRELLRGLSADASERLGPALQLGSLLDVVRGLAHDGPAGADEGRP